MVLGFTSILKNIMIMNWMQTLLRKKIRYVIQSTSPPPIGILCSKGSSQPLPGWLSWWEVVVQFPAGPTLGVLKLLMRRCCLCSNICKWLDLNHSLDENLNAVWSQLETLKKYVTL
jgi:hypothetical protein